MKHLFTLLCLASAMFAADPAADIRKVLTDQQDAWNRADIAAFMEGYNDSSETTFVGKTITKGYAGVLARYRKNYPDAAAMGTLEFSELEVKLLGKDYAIVTGHFHLTRTAQAGGESKGIFSLLFEREKTGWKIILDHTS